MDKDKTKKDKTVNVKVRGEIKLIISAEPETLNALELSFSEEETKEARLKAEPTFPEDLYEILEFIHQQNELGKKPSYKDITKQFGITRATTRKRIKRLKNRGLVIDRKKGRFKVLELTDKGRDFF
jgi:uncharacterized membrane protein